MAKLSLDGVSKIYGRNRVVHDFNLQVGDGEFVVLVGPSGCGKSTILRMIAGLESVSAGMVRIDAEPVNDIPPKDRDIAMVFQNYSLYPHMTVFGNMAFGLKMRKMKKEQILERVRRTAETLGLKGLLDSPSRNLSGGQQQRVALGRAIVREPRLFLFDEPLSNLDAGLRLEMRAELIRLHKKLSATMIYVTHDQVEAMSMGDRLVVLKEGAIRQIGKPLEIYNNPADLFVAGFIGSPPMNFLIGKIERREAGEIGLTFEGSCFNLEMGHFPELAEYAKSHEKVVVGLRPEDFLSGSKFDLGDERLPKLSVLVEYIEPLGSEILAACKLGETSLKIRLAPARQINSGQRLELSVRSKSLKLFDIENGEALQ